MSTGKNAQQGEIMMLDKIRDALQDRLLNVVAQRTGLSSRTVSNVKYSVGTPNAATIKVLADYLGVKDEQG